MDPGAHKQIPPRSAETSSLHPSLLDFPPIDNEQKNLSRMAAVPSYVEVRPSKDVYNQETAAVPESTRSVKPSAPVPNFADIAKPSNDVSDHDIELAQRLTMV